MPDTRPRASKNGKTVSLKQLDLELGNFGLCENETEVVVAEGSPVTQVQLAAALAVHVAPPDTTAQRHADAEAALASLAATAGIRTKSKAILAGTDAFNNQQRDRALAAAVLVLLRDQAGT